MHNKPFSRRLFLGQAALAAAALLAPGCATGAEPVGAMAPVQDYRLGPGDELRIAVYGEPDLSNVFTVGAQGTIAYPLIGEIQAAGLTLVEFSARLQSALEAFIRAPNVTVQVANYRPFFILGEVQRPGTYEYSANLTVLNAVATAGGFTYRANRRRVFIRHANEAEEQPFPLTTSTPVLPGDTIRIGERLF